MTYIGLLPIDDGQPLVATPDGFLPIVVRPLDPGLGGSHTKLSLDD